MKIKNTIKYVAATAALALGNVLTASAQYKDFDQVSRELTSELKTIGANVINVLSIVLGIVAAVRLIPIFIKRGKNEGQTSELLTDWGFTLIFVIIGLQLVKLILL